MNINSLFKYAVYYPVVFYKTNGFFDSFSHFSSSQFLDESYHASNQLKKFRDIVEYSVRNVPVYGKLLNNLRADDINSLSDIAELPFVTKQMLRDSGADFRSTHKHSSCVVKTTGGSTGQPVTILKSRQAMGCELAATWRGYSWAGIGIGDKQARFWGVPFAREARLQARLIDFVCHRKRLSAFSFDQAALAGYVRTLKRFNPDYFYGYVSMLNEFADYIATTGQSNPFSLKAIITTSEVLTDAVRDKLESVFQAPVYNEYGCGEIGSVAHECPEGQLHLCAENMLVEIVDEAGSPCAPGQVGELVVTELNNTAMPLIRYRLGDLGTLSAKRCPCGRGLPVLQGLKGRAYDTVRLENGKMFHGEFFMYIFEGAKREELGFAQFQVVQQTRNGFRIKLVREQVDGRKRLEEYISRHMYAGMGDDITIEFEYVETIPRTRSGKMQLIQALGN